MAKSYDVFADYDDETLTEVAFSVMKRWLAFAVGVEELNGHRIKSPTGRYASAIRVESRGPHHVAIVADGNIAPEADVLEEGHGAIDLKQYLGGRAIPLYRGVPGQYGSAGYGAPIVSSVFSARSRNVWAAPRAQGATGIRRVPTPTMPGRADAWVIPAMNAWSPAGALADMIRRGEFDPQ